MEALCNGHLHYQTPTPLNILQRRPIGAINATAFNYPPPGRDGGTRATKEGRKSDEDGEGVDKRRENTVRGEQQRVNKEVYLYACN